MKSEPHPIAPFLNIETKFLFLGSFPPGRLTQPERLTKGDILFYYGSNENYFWRVMGILFPGELPVQNLPGIKRPLPSLETVTKFLLAHGMGVSDLYERICRTKECSLDSNLRPLALRDFSKVQIQCPKLKAVLFTSEFVTREFTRYFPEILHSDLFFATLISPSGAANLSIGRSSDFKEKKMLRPEYTVLDYRVEKYRDIFLNVGIL